MPPSPPAWRSLRAFVMQHALSLYQAWCSFPTFFIGGIQPCFIFHWTKRHSLSQAEEEGKTGKRDFLPSTYPLPSYVPCVPHPHPHPLLFSSGQVHGRRLGGLSSIKTLFAWLVVLVAGGGTALAFLRSGGKYIITKIADMWIWFLGLHLFLHHTPFPLPLPPPPSHLARCCLFPPPHHHPTTTPTLPHPPPPAAMVVDRRETFLNSFSSPSTRLFGSVCPCGTSGTATTCLPHCPPAPSAISLSPLLTPCQHLVFSCVARCWAVLGGMPATAACQPVPAPLPWHSNFVHYWATAFNMFVNGLWDSGISVSHTHWHCCLLSPAPCVHALDASWGDGFVPSARWTGTYILNST